jgi:hypothetical protein
MNNGKYRCVHCGEYFDDPEYEEIADCGFFAPPPDTCEECCDMINHPPHDINELHSDSDPGL